MSMDVNRAQGIASIANNAGGGGRDPHHKEHPDELPEEEAAVEDSEAFEIDGLMAEITPSAQIILDNLAAEIEPLRRQLEMAREREQNLREDLARHSFLPIPGRREFIRELNHVLNHLGDLTSMPSLGLLHVANGDEVRRTYGRDTLDRLLVHVAEAVNRTLQPTDILGSLGGNDFAVILLGAGAVMARERIDGIVQSVSKMPIHEQGVPISPVLRASTAELSAGATAEASIKAADRNRAR